MEQWSVKQVGEYLGVKAALIIDGSLLQLFKGRVQQLVDDGSGQGADGLFVAVGQIGHASQGFIKLALFDAFGVVFQ